MVPILQEAPGPALSSGAVWRFDRDVLRPPHFHGQLEILIARSGAATLTLGCRSVRFVAGQIAWILPGIAHVTSDFDAGTDFWVVHVEPWLASRALARDRSLSSRYGGWIESVSRAFGGRALAEPERTTFDVLDSLALRWMGSLGTERETILESLVTLAFARSAANIVKGAQPSLAFWVPSLLAADPQTDRSGLARRVGVSDAYLTRLLRRELGVSFETQRSRARLVSFLAEVDMARRDGRRVSLLDAAIAAGFGSYSQLHRTFVGTVGFRPTDYVLGQGREHRLRVVIGAMESILAPA